MYFKTVENIELICCFITDMAKEGNLKESDVTALCQKHSDEISHICMKCVQTVCVKCIDHADHEDKVEEYQEGIDHLKDSLKETKKKLKEEQNIIEKCQNQLDSQQSEANKQTKELQRRRDALVKEIEQINHELVDVGETERKCNEDVKMYKELKKKFDASCTNVDSLLQSPFDQIVSSFLNECTLAGNILKEAEECKDEFRRILSRELKWLAKPVMKTNFADVGNFPVKYPSSIKALGRDLFVYSDGLTNRFVVFDSEGTVIRSFEGLMKHGHVRCVDVYNNQLYLAQEKQILCISNFNTTQEESTAFLPKVYCLYRMAVANDNILICTSYKEGTVYEYNTEDNTTNPVLKNLVNPAYITVDHTPQGTRYILSLAPISYFSNDGSVKIFNISWQLLTTINIGTPMDPAPCPGGFLLGDYDNNEITLYSYEGDKVRAVRAVLKEDDGLYHPASLTIKPPYQDLWVGHKPANISKITCFRVFE